MPGNRQQVQVITLFEATVFADIQDACQMMYDSWSCLGVVKLTDKSFLTDLRAPYSALTVHPKGLLASCILTDRAYQMAEHFSCKSLWMTTKRALSDMPHF